LTLGIAILVMLAGFGTFKGMHPYWAATLAAGILLGAGLLASELALGLIPEFTYTNTAGPPPVRLLIIALQGYVNTYGWSLALSSAAVGAGVGLQVVQWRERWSSSQA
jgi:hypothetical protein